MGVCNPRSLRRLYGIISQVAVFAPPPILAFLAQKAKEDPEKKTRIFLSAEPCKPWKRFPKSHLSPLWSMGTPHSADKKFVRARGPQNWNPEVFEQTRCSRILHVEFPQNNRELVKAEVFEKRVFEQTTPFKLRK